MTKILNTKLNIVSYLDLNKKSNNYGLYVGHYAYDMNSGKILGELLCSYDKCYAIKKFDGTNLQVFCDKPKYDALDKNSIYYDRLMLEKSVLELKAVIFDIIKRSRLFNYLKKYFI